MYNFNNKSDAELDELIFAAMTEQTNRILRKIDTYPKPELLTCNKFEDVKVYRQNHDVSLKEAMMVVTWHKEKSNEQ